MLRTNFPLFRRVWKLRTPDKDTESRPSVLTPAASTKSNEQQHVCQSYPRDDTSSCLICAAGGVNATTMLDAHQAPPKERGGEWRGKRSRGGLIDSQPLAPGYARPAVQLAVAPTCIECSSTTMTLGK